MAALSVAGSLVQVVNILFLVRKFKGHEVLMHGTCGLVYFLLYFSIHLCVLILVAMTIERYLAIRFPLKAIRWFSPRRAGAAVGVLCLLAMAISLHHLVIWQMDWNVGLQVIL